MQKLFPWTRNIEYIFTDSFTILSLFIHDMCLIFFNLANLISVQLVFSRFDLVSFIPMF